MNCKPITIGKKVNQYKHKEFFNSENHLRFDKLKQSKNLSTTDKDFVSKYLSSQIVYVIESNLDKVTSQNPNKKIAFEKTKLEILGKLNEEIFGKN